MTDFRSRRDSFIELAATEIGHSYGDQVTYGRKSLFKFGRNRSLGTAREIVSTDGIVPVLATTNTLTHFSSSEVADVQVLSVEGVTISGGVLTYAQQFITLNGRTKTALTTPLSRCTRIAHSGLSSTPTTGDVYVYTNAATVTNGVPGSEIGAIMEASDQSTLRAATSVANNGYYIMTDWYAGIAKKTGSVSADIRLEIKPVDSTAWRTIQVKTATSSSSTGQEFRPHYIIPPNSDIQMTAVGSTSNIDITAGFDGFFMDIVG